MLHSNILGIAGLYHYRICGGFRGYDNQYGCRGFGGMYCLHLQAKRYRKCVLPRLVYSVTGPYAVINCPLSQCGLNWV